MSAGSLTWAMLAHNSLGKSTLLMVTPSRKDFFVAWLIMNGS